MEITGKHEHGPVDLRWTEDGGNKRRVVTPGDDLSSLPGAVRTEIEAHWTPERIAAWEAHTAPALLPPPSARAVNAERDRRVAAGFVFNGVTFDSRVEDQKRIAGAGALAVAAVINGAKPGDLRWHGGAADFAWIAADNSLVPMDAQTVIAFGQAAARWESLHVFAARALKDMAVIPADYAADKHWP